MVHRSSRQRRLRAAVMGVMVAGCWVGAVAAAADPNRERNQLQAAVSAYVEALRKGAVVEGSANELGLVLQFFPDAWTYWVVDRLAEVLSDPDRSLDAVQEELRAALPRLKPGLSGKPGFRLRVLHAESESASRETQAVHFFSARIHQALRFRLGKREVEWRAWREENLEPLETLRVARHYTVKNRRRVPFVSPLKPKGARFVFRGRTASIFGLVPAAVVTKKPGRLTMTVSFEEFVGHYDDEHIVDLNAAGNVWRPDLNATLEGELPFHFPAVPARVEAFLRQIDATP